MKDRVVAEAVRMEYEEKTGDLYIVFKVKDEKYKQELKKNWTKDIEFRLVDKVLVEADDGT
jgi:hypothetical protein